MKLELDAIPSPGSLEALDPESASAALLDGAQDAATNPEVTVPGPAANASPLASSSPVDAASSLTTALPYALDAQEAAEEGAAERRGALPSAVRSVASGWRHAAVNDAFAKLGTRYRWGGEQPGGFDCSGFVQYVMRKQGIELPRTAREMRSATRPIGSHELQPGDLVFFRNPDHVGIYIGDKTFVHASSGRGQVTVSTLDGGYYQQRYIGSGRAAE